MDFDPAAALRYARNISVPRKVGSPAEESTALFLINKLEGFGYEVATQEFRFSNTLDPILRLEMLAGLGIILWSCLLWLQSGQAPGLNGVLILLILVLVQPLNHAVQKASFQLPGEPPPSVWKSLCLRLGETFRTRNILASPPDSCRASPRPHLYIVSHYDSKSQRVSLVKRIALYIFFVSGSLIFALLILAGMVFPGLQTTAYLLALALMIGGIPLLMLAPGNESPGAIDNAAGVGLSLQLAESYFQDSTLRKRLVLKLLITSAEEFALMGARAFAQANRGDLEKIRKDNPLFILNLEGNGVAGKFFYVSGPQRHRPDHVPDLSLLLRQAGLRAGITIRRLVMPGALLDHMPFAEYGFDAISLVTIGNGTRMVHTRQDSPGKLSAAGFSQSGQILTGLFEQIAQSAENPL